MRGGPRAFPQGFSCPVVLWILPCRFGLRIRGFHPLLPVFPVPFSCPLRSLMQSEPRSARTAVWALPVPLAATPGITFVFFSSGYLDVSVHRVPLRALWIRARIHGVCPCGFPHSEIRGSPDICSSPRLFAAYHVFLRLSVPRHPPCALSCLTSFPDILHSVAAACSFSSSVFCSGIPPLPEPLSGLMSFHCFWIFSIRFSRCVLFHVSRLFYQPSGSASLLLLPCPDHC